MKFSFEIGVLNEVQEDSATKIIRQSEPSLRDQNSEDILGDIRALQPSNIKHLAKYVRSVLLRTQAGWNLGAPLRKFLFGPTFFPSAIDFRAFCYYN